MGGYQPYRGQHPSFKWVTMKDHDPMEKQLDFDLNYLFGADYTTSIETCKAHALAPAATDVKYALAALLGATLVILVVKRRAFREAIA